MRVQISKKQKEFLTSTSKNVCFIGGVGSGKTLIAAEKIVQLLIKGAYVVVLASTYKQLKLVLFQMIQDRLNLHNIPFEVNKSDMIISIPKVDGKVFGYSTENIESVRGITVDVAVFDEAALMSEYDFKVTFGRLRRGKVPLQTFITTTPRGKDNWVYDLAQDPDTHLIHQTTFENPFLPREFIEEISKNYEGDLAKQELEGGFIDASNELSFFPHELYLKGIKNIKPQEVNTELKIGGLDVARFGKDSSVLVERQGKVINNVKKWNNLDTTVLIDDVINFVIENSLDYLIVDAVGLGAPIFDQLNNRLKTVCRVIEFNGGYKSTDPKYFNKRTESFGRLKEWIEGGGCLTTDFGDLTSFNFKLNSKGEIQLESKSDLKSRTGKSPDGEDALSMTFAVDSKKRTTRQERSKRNKEKVYRNVFVG